MDKYRHPDMESSDQSLLFFIKQFFKVQCHAFFMLYLVVFKHCHFLRRAKVKRNALSWEHFCPLECVSIKPYFCSYKALMIKLMQVKKVEIFVLIQL